jgi:tRNA pseudouridine(38-40) synthase
MVGLPDGGAAESRRARFTVAYDGTDYHGFAFNHGVRTVIGDLTDAISRIVRAPVELTGAGRTDAGVHAWGQVVTVELPATADLDDLARRVNKLCAPGLAIRDPAWTAPDFDARFSATWREYRYQVWNDLAPNPLLARTAWHVAPSLDLTLMGAAVSPLIGEHDFASFCRAPKVAEGQPPAWCGSCTRSAGNESTRRRCCGCTSGGARSATRWCARSSALWSMSARASSPLPTSTASSAPATVPSPDRWRRRTASCCVRCATTAIAGTPEPPLRTGTLEDLVPTPYHCRVPVAADPAALRRRREFRDR